MVQYVVYYVQYDLSTHEYTLELHTLPHSCTDRGQTRLPAVRELFFSHHKNRAKSNKMARLLAFASLLATGPDMGPTMAAGQLRWQRLQHHELLRGSGFESRS